MAACWLNGELVAKEQARISVFDHGLLYGDGVFEGIRFYRRRPFRLVEHLRRLQYSATAIGLNMPYTPVQLTDAVDATIQAYGEADGYLRLVITRGVGPLGIDPAACKQGTAFVIADRLSFMSERVRQQGAKLIIASIRRLPPDGLDPRIKSLNYLNHVLARMEAGRAGADEAILLNGQGRVAEGSTDNIFVVRDGRLLTPPVTDGALQGVTRDLVLDQVAAELDITVAEVGLTPYDLYTAEECFLTGTAVELIPVREIDGRRMPACPGPVYHTVQAAFHAVVQRETNGGVS